MPAILSFLAYGSFGSTVRGLNDFPRDQWPHDVELLYYSYHIMVGLGTLFILTMGVASLLLLRGRLATARPMLWVLMLAFPFPYIATTAGWWTAELGRQPWVIHGLMRTADAHSALVNPGDVIFTTLGFAGLYLLLGMLFVVHDPPRDQPRPGRAALRTPTMEAVWYAIVSGMLAVYAVLDGFDFGVGIVHRLVARTDEERRTVLAAIGPVWDGNEVWLIAAGGVLFMAFPRVYATAFSGFYLALMIVLWLLILRGVAIEFRSHQDNPLWREFWDTVFSAASALLAVAFGTTLGNLVRGVPLGKEGLPGMPLFTDFRPGREPGILDWYTGLVGLFTLATLAGHGALYLAWRTDGPVREHSLVLARGAWKTALVLWGVATAATAWVRPDLFSGLGCAALDARVRRPRVGRGLGSPPAPGPGPGAGRLPRLVRVPLRASGHGPGGELPVLAPVDARPLRKPHRDQFRLRQVWARGGARLVGRRDHPGRRLLHPPVPLGAR